MAFRVEISPRAFADLDEIAAYIKRQGSFDQAEEWFNGIIAAIQTLEDLPNRCPLADESVDLEQQVHFLLYGRRNRRYPEGFATEPCSAFPTSRKFPPGIVKFVPAGRKWGANLLDTILGSSVALTGGRRRSAARRI